MEWEIRSLEAAQILRDLIGNKCQANYVVKLTAEELIILNVH
jgi:hypothetical protein